MTVNSTGNNQSAVCRICGGDVFGYGGNIKMPLCKEHYVKTVQLSCFYGDVENCPYDGTPEEWAAVTEIFEGNNRQVT